MFCKVIEAVTPLWAQIAEEAGPLAVSNAWNFPVIPGKRYRAFVTAQNDIDVSGIESRVIKFLKGTSEQSLTTLINQQAPNDSFPNFVNQFEFVAELPWFRIEYAGFDDEYEVLGIVVAHAFLLEEV